MIRRFHAEKLRCLFEIYWEGGKEGEKEEGEGEEGKEEGKGKEEKEGNGLEEAFGEALYSLLCRYKTLFG